MTRPLRLRHQGEVHSIAVRELGGGRLQVEQAGAEPVTLQLPQRGVYSVAVGTTLAPTMASSASTMPRISRPKNEMPRCEDRCAVFILSLHLQSRLFS